MHARCVEFPYVHAFMNTSFPWAEFLTWANNLGDGCHYSSSQRPPGTRELSKLAVRLVAVREDSRQGEPWGHGEEGRRYRA